MLFDLRARGRRRTVQVVYVGLALLFLVGFVGFGVGVGGGGGGLVEGLFGGKEGSGGSSYASKVAAAESRTKKHPAEAAAWAALVEARFHQAGEPGGEFYDEEKQQFTGKGKQLLVKVASDWNRYVALKPSSPTLAIAYDMIRAFGEEGLSEPAQEVAVLQYVIPTKPPSASLYGYLAKAAYQAKNVSVGDLASQKVVSLTPASERKRVKAYLAQLKSNPSGNPSNETFTGTTNGKVYSVKVNSQGQGTVVKTSPASTTTAKKK
jgi:hypothetical protein